MPASSAINMPGILKYENSKLAEQDDATERFQRNVQATLDTVYTTIHPTRRIIVAVAYELPDGFVDAKDKAKVVAKLYNAVKKELGITTASEGDVERVKKIFFGSENGKRWLREMFSPPMVEMPPHQDNNLGVEASDQATGPSGFAILGGVSPRGQVTASSIQTSAGRATQRNPGDGSGCIQCGGANCGNYPTPMCTTGPLISAPAAPASTGEAYIVEETVLGNPGLMDAHRAWKKEVGAAVFTVLLAMLGVWVTQREDFSKVARG